DGLQGLALHYATRTAHGPFFAPLFRALRGADPEELGDPMRAFLESPRVNGRTDDDKTLILAARG
ncbi:MAG: PP2C family serine/threonine-protein phosphatase, partial [Gemmataceae bacterium]